MPKAVTPLVERLTSMATGDVIAGDGVTVRRTKDDWWYVEYGDHSANLITLASVVEQLWGAQLAEVVPVLTPEEREFAIESALHCVANDHVVRVIADAPNDAAAIAAARDEISNWGYYRPHKPGIRGIPKGLELVDDDWRRLELIPYREIVERVRHKQPAQMTLW